MASPHLSSALAAWDGRARNDAETLAALGSALAEAARREAEEKLAAYQREHEGCIETWRAVVSGDQQEIASERAAREAAERENATLKTVALANQNAALDLAAKLEAAERERDEEIRTHDEIAKSCFGAGATTPDGTSVGAVRSLIALKQSAESRLARATEALREAAAVLRTILDYEPREVCKDEFAYNRMVENYRDAARRGLAALSSSPEARRG